MTRSGVWVMVVAVSIWLNGSGSSGTEETFSDVKKVPVVFSGGDETDPWDGGRPVILVAAALGVPVDVLREAFSHVRPTQAGNEP